MFQVLYHNSKQIDWILDKEHKFLLTLKKLCYNKNSKDLKINFTINSLIIISLLWFNF
jgi:hypothetical protein